jgi:hypothetical protein
MEGVQQVVELIQLNDFATLVHPGQRRCCRFRAPDGTRYQWKTVSFGMAETPQICTKLLRTLIKILKGLGIRCLIYIDDLLILHQDWIQLAKPMAIVMEFLQEQVGLQLKVSKGQWVPSQVFTCLGLAWNTMRMQVAVPPKRIKAIQRPAARIQKTAASGKPVPTRDLARLVGQITSTNRAIRPAKRRLLYLQHDLGRAVKKTGWKGQVLLSKQALLALDWWQGSNPWRTNGDDDILPPVRPLQTSDVAHGRSHQQRGVRGRDDLPGSKVFHVGVPYERGTERALHKRVRVLRDGERLTGFIAGGDSRQKPLAFGSRTGGARQPHVRETRDGGGVAVNKDVEQQDFK